MIKERPEKSESTEAAQKNIRILLMTDGYKQIVHKELKVSATGGLIIEKLVPGKRLQKMRK